MLARSLVVLLVLSSATPALAQSPRPGRAAGRPARPADAPAPLPGPRWVTTPTTVYAGPGADLPVLSTLGAYAKVQVRDCVADWCIVGHLGGIGYVPARVLTSVPPADLEALPPRGTAASPRRRPARNVRPRRTP